MTKFTWSGQGTSSAWNDAGNWRPGGVPGAGDIAAFTGANATVTGDEVAGEITALVATSLVFTGHVGTAGLAGHAASFEADGGARLTFTAGADLTVADRLEVGITGGASTLLFAGTTLDTQAALIGLGAGAQGALTLDNGALWRDAGLMTIGRSGDGGLSVNGGATLMAGTFGRHPHGGDIVLGQLAAGQGALDVSGGGEVLTAGTLSVGGSLGAASHGTGQLTVGPQSTIDALGAVTIAAGSLAALAGGSLGGGVIDVAAGGSIEGSGSVTGDGLVDDGQIVAFGQLFLEGAITGSGTLAMSAGATLGLGDARVSQAAIRFLGAGATLLLQAPPPSPAGLIEGFRPGDTIVAPYVDQVSFDAPTDQLTLYVDGTAAGTLAFAGSYTASQFHVAAGGTITLTHHG